MQLGIDIHIFALLSKSYITKKQPLEQNTQNYAQNNCGQKN